MSSDGMMFVIFRNCDSVELPKDTYYNMFCNSFPVCLCTVYFKVKTISAV